MPTGRNHSRLLGIALFLGIAVYVVTRLLFIEADSPRQTLTGINFFDEGWQLGARNRYLFGQFSVPWDKWDPVLTAPLSNWMTYVAFRLLGLSLFSLRLAVIAFSSLALVLFLAWVRRQLKTAGMVAFLSLWAFSFPLAAAQRIAMVEGYLTGFFLLVLCGWIGFVKRRSPLGAFGLALLLSLAFFFVKSSAILFVVPILIAVNADLPSQERRWPLYWAAQGLGLALGAALFYALVLRCGASLPSYLYMNSEHIGRRTPVSFGAMLWCLRRLFLASSPLKYCFPLFLVLAVSSRTALGSPVPRSLLSVLFGSALLTALRGEAYRYIVLIPLLLLACVWVVVESRGREDNRMTAGAISRGQRLAAWLVLTLATSAALLTYRSTNALFIGLSGPYLLLLLVYAAGTLCIGAALMDKGPKRLWGVGGMLLLAVCLLVFVGKRLYAGVAAAYLLPVQVALAPLAAEPRRIEWMWPFRRGEGWRVGVSLCLGLFAWLFFAGYLSSYVNYYVFQTFSDPGVFFLAVCATAVVFLLATFPRMRRTLAVSALAAYLAINAQALAAYFRAPQWTVRDASLQMAQIVREGELVVGHQGCFVSYYGRFKAIPWYPGIRYASRDEDIGALSPDFIMTESRARYVGGSFLQFGAGDCRTPAQAYRCYTNIVRCFPSSDYWPRSIDDTNSNYYYLLRR